MRDAADQMNDDDQSDSQIPPPREALRSLTEPPPAPKSPAVETKTPAAWAAKLGHVRKAIPNVPQSTDGFDWQHAAADSLHGWSDDAYHYGDQFEISQAAYEAALNAAAHYPNVGPCEGALPESQKIRHAGFVPRAGEEKV